jgi:O104-antigen biosynthesis beta-1,3-galactosyltransferase
MTMKLSVLMSVYGKETADCLRQSLESVAAQSLAADQVVLVEDGPLSEELRATIGHCSAILPLVSLRLPERVGLGAALRAGLNECQGEYVARMDSDDICVPRRFEKQMDFLDAHPEVDVVGGAIAEFDEVPWLPHSLRILPEGGEALLRYARYRTPMNHVTVVARKASLEAAGSYRASRFFQDYHLWARMLALGFRLHNLRDVLVYVRCGNGMHARRGGMAYLKEEISFQSYLRSLGLQSVTGSFLSVLLRGPVRLAPDPVRRLCYRLLLRERARDLQNPLFGVENDLLDTIRPS